MKWLEKFDVLDPDHIHDLERASARNEFHMGLPRDASEQLAHEEYKRKQMIKGAAYHLDALDFAKSNGDSSKSQKHYNMYNLYCNKLGFNPSNSVPPEIAGQRGQFQDLTKSNYPSDLYILSKK